MSTSSFPLQRHRAASDLRFLQLEATNRSSATVAATVVAITGVSAILMLIGADARWLAALGNFVATHRAVPTGVPFAGVPTDHWPNAIVLAELLFHWLEAGLGDRGLMLAQVLAVGIGMAVLARDALTEGASNEGAIIALLIGSAGALSSLTTVRDQLFSLALFPILVKQLRADARAPSRRIWLVLPLLVVWANLHGAAVIGLAVVLIYLALRRFSQAPGTSLAVGLTAVLAVCLTPAGIRTIDYYHGVMTNQLATRGEGLWSPLSLTAPLDVVLLIATVVLASRLRRIALPIWEVAVAAILAALTIHASRSGVWLLFFVIPVAARGINVQRIPDRPVLILGIAACAGLAIAIVRGPLATAASPTMVRRAVLMARGTPILAEPVPAEEVALAGGRVWVSDPLDAFSPRDQAVYLNWIEGRTPHIPQRVSVVLTLRGSSADRLMAQEAGFVPVAYDSKTELFARTH
jgi:hypothetical protein